MAESHNFQASHLHSIVRRLFVAAGTPLHIAQDVAEILVNANLAGPRLARRAPNPRLFARH